MTNLTPQRTRVGAGRKTGRRRTGNGHSNGGNGHLSGIRRTGDGFLFDQSGINKLTTIVKRDGRVVEFDVSRIERAIERCFESFGKVSGVGVSELALRVVNVIAAKYSQPTVENVQDAVEVVLQAAGEFEAAKRYILYRAEHAKLRGGRPIPSEVREAFLESDKYFPTQLQKFQFYDKYARFNYDLGRRETWVETVDRAMSFLREVSARKMPQKVYERVRRAVLEMKVAPSMRLLATAGDAARRQNISIYNCSYLPADSVESFGEAMLISMSGCGVGFSVEGKYVEKLPRVKRQLGGEAKLFVVPDSTEGWVEALNTGLEHWLEGGDVKYDYSLVRPAGTILKTKGGRASGPEPLRVLLDFARDRILSRRGSFLRPVDAHDLMCMVGYAAVSGGVRRTAMISLFDWDDLEMRLSKSGDFERDNWQRWNANNSVVIPEGGLTQQEFLRLMLDMFESGRGEPGIFNRPGMIKFRPERRGTAEFGTNPCGEIILRPQEFCNLSIAIARQGDTYEGLREKVEIATILGTMQSMATYFPGLRSIWKKNGEEERLLGVDITGQLDCQAIQDPAVMSRLRQVAVDTNREYARALGINQSASVTCVKPSGNSSQLFNCASGLHARWAQYYVRNVRVGAHTPVFKVMKDVGVPMDPENGQDADSANTWVAHFPVKSPPGSVTRKDRPAIEQCEYWLNNKVFWTEHNPSVTITYQPNEVVELIGWLWKHKDLIGGMSFLPAADAKYAQMPYEEVSREEYEVLLSKFPNIDFSKLYRYEEEDYTKAAQELACVAGACEVEMVPDGKGGMTVAKMVN